MYYFYVDNYMESVNVENLFDINLLNNSEKLKFCKGVFHTFHRVFHINYENKEIYKLYNSNMKLLKRNMFVTYL